MRVAALVVVAGCGRVNFDATPVSDAAYSGPNRAFVTAGRTNGAFGGVTGGDAICQAAAAGAHLDGEFVALVFDGLTLRAPALSGSRGWVDLHGRAIADQPSDFEMAATFSPIIYDELGQEISGFIWTGSVAGECGVWTMAASNVFVPVIATYQALRSGFAQDAACSDNLHLLCVERGRNSAVVPAIESGRIAFVSDTGFSPGGGLAAADALCNADAGTAGLLGTYRAWLGSTAGGPETRFASTGEPWRRVDGIRLSVTAGDFLSPDLPLALSTFLNRTALGNVRNEQIFTGVTGNCIDWTSSSLADQTNVGDSSSAERQRLRDASLPLVCTAARPIVCLQL
ncbi:MAG: Tryptophan synthase alpha chain [Myxococcales bacterium]|nr:Tryptophan synthase alpha chain [Myxococcales bacterium]